MANRLLSAGTDLDSIFQSYVSGDIVQSTTTNIKNGDTDIKSRYAGRDNKAGNASTAVNFTYGGVALNGLFNKIGATYDVTISGTRTYNGAAQTPTLTHSPTNTPTQATITSKTNAGSYTTADFTITLPGNYLPGTYSGTFTINRLSITAMSFTLNGVAFTTAQSRTAGTNYTIAVSSVTPAAATYSPTSIVRSAAGTYSLTSSGTGNYQGSFTSPVLTLTAVVSGSIAETDRITAYSVQLTATLTGATATGYSWSRTGGTYAGTVNFSSTTTQVVTATVSSAAGTNNSIIRCIISYSGGTVSPTITIGWGVL